MKKFLSLVLALVMTMSLVTVSAGAKDFADDSSINYKAAVDVISELGVVDGYSDNSFRPDNLLTRGAAAKIICNLILGPTTASALSASTAPFKDVPTTNTFAGYITYCAQQGIISGYGDGTFRPTGTLSGNAFMKMLLGALGYDSSIEHYTGANWQVNVVKQASGIGLLDGNSSFIGSNPVSRGEAALYAFNMLQTTMVEYDTQSTIVVGDIEINTASTRDEVSNPNTSDNTIEKDGKMQFAERYFTDLRKSTGDSDEFERPSTTWRLKSQTIGTYADEANVTYTEEVRLSDIYSDLGLSNSISAANVTFHVDGKTEANSGNDNSSTPVALNTLGLSRSLTNKIGGNGILTEAFYDDDANTVTITMVNTYAGKVTGLHNATSTRDAYISIAPAASGVGVGGSYETDESFRVDDIVTYNYSSKAGDQGIYNVAPAESVTGELTGYTDGKTITLGGNTYTANKAYATKITSLTGATGYEADAYLDAYGYVVYLDTSKSSDNYAVVLAADNNDIDGNRVKLLFTDGTDKVVTLKSGTAVPSGSFAGNDTGINLYDIVSYSVDGDSKYTLNKVADSTRNGNSGVTIVTNGSAVPTVKNANGYVASNRAQISAYTGKTIFLVKDSNGDYSTYTGIANVPTIKVGTTNTYVTQFAKTVTGTSPASGAATVVYIDASGTGASIDNNSKDVVFVKGSSVGTSYTPDEGSYYEYTAIVNGEITKIKVDAASRTTANTLYNTVSYNSKGIATLSNGVGAGPNPAADDTYGNTTDGLLYSDGTTNKLGTDTESNGTIGLFGSYYAYADDVQVFYIDTDGNISAWSIGSIAEDANDKVWAKFVDGEVTTIVIEDVDDGAGGGSSSATSANINYVLEIVNKDTFAVLETRTHVLQNVTNGTYAPPTASQAFANVCSALTDWGISDPTLYGVIKDNTSVTVNGVDVTLTYRVFLK